MSSSRAAWPTTSRGIPTGHFDCVILNSIVQYFPNVDYLLDVLAGAVRSLRPGGTIYVGDVRNLQLLPAYHAAVQLHQAGDDLPLPQLQALIQQRLRDEEELLIDPDFFYALPQRFPEIDSVDVHLKRGSYHNELTQFRYQVVLHLAQPADGQEQQTWHAHRAWHEVHWGEAMDTPDALLAQLRQHLLVQPDDGLVVRNIPNARVHAYVQALTNCVRIKPSPTSPKPWRSCAHQLAQTNGAVDPESLWALSTSLPFAVHVTWSHSPGAVDACFVPQTDNAQLPALLACRWLPAGLCCRPHAWHSYTNNPTVRQAESLADTCTAHLDAGEAARLHDPGRLRTARGAAPHPQRQGRPQGPARS